MGINRKTAQPRANSLSMFLSALKRDEGIYLPLDQEDDLELAKKRSSRRGRRYLTMFMLLAGMVSFILFVATYMAFNATVRAFSSTEDPAPPLLLISIDGFRYDYLYRGLTPTLARLARSGMHGPMKPQFPTYTFPNHYSLVTGLYPESHGIVGNAFYDPDLDDYFSYTDREKLTESKWWTAEPIWNTVQRFGMKSATMFWPGSESAIKGLRPTYYHGYDGEISPAKRVSQILKWLDLPPSKRPSFMSLYFSEVDEASHLHGPDSEQVNKALKNVDGALGLLINGLKTRELLGTVNLLVVSDHGMMKVSHHIYLDDMITDMEERIEWVDYGPVTFIQPVEEEVDDIYLKLKYYSIKNGKFSVYRRSDLPRHFHFRENDRIAPIVIVCDPGWIIDFHGEDWVPVGAHGYDPAVPEMQALFIGTGPGLSSLNEPLDDISNLDVYPLMMHLLNIPALPNNGTMKLVQYAN